MNTKKVFTIVLLLFVISSVGFLMVQELRKSSSSPSAESDAVVNEQSHVADDNQSVFQEETSVQPLQVIAYYFHGNTRCVSCKKIEAWAFEAITNGFIDEIENDTLEWRVVNVDEPENEHFVQDYQLSTRSVVLVKVKQGREVEWQNLDKVWVMLNNKDSFIAYVKAHVKEYLGDNS